MPQIELLNQHTNDSAILLVEGLLERLRSGHAVSIALVEVRRDRSVATAYANVGGSYHLLNSGAARLSIQIASITD